MSGDPAPADSLADELQQELAREPIDLARAALVIAKLEYPSLDPQPSLDELERLGERTAARMADTTGDEGRAGIRAVNAVLYDEAGFSGNRSHYDDFRNSCLNVVLERRLGIPITLAVVYIDVARRAGIAVSGIAFPGHFLMRTGSDGSGGDIVLDPFSRGVEMHEGDCRALLASRMGDDAAYDPELLQPCTSRQLIARMLNNLKRTYVEMRSFEQARRVTDLLLCTDATLLSEQRDRGLLSYQLDDYPAALRDLEDYLRLRLWNDPDDREERDQIWEHVKSLRRRIAGLN